jgi:hypothetical protein
MLTSLEFTKDGVGFKIIGTVVKGAAYYDIVKNLSNGNIKEIECKTLNKIVQKLTRN